MKTWKAFLLLFLGPALPARAQQVGGDWTATGGQGGTMFGWAVAHGDFNGDGLGDVAIGAPFHDGGNTDEGRVYVYYGASGTGLSGSPWTAESNQAGAWFGYSVASAGDVNGDGADELLVGAPHFDNGQTDEGGAYLFLGSPGGGLSPTAVWTAESDQAGALFGVSVSGAGDVDGDGLDDAIVGAPNYTGANYQEGAAYVYCSTGSSLTTAACWSVEGGQIGAGLGISAAAAGDVDGDGFDDVIVGAPGRDGPQVGSGRASIYFGSLSDPPLGPGWSVDGTQVNEGLGRWVAAAGDVDGDGYDDVLVGSPLYTGGQTYEGRAQLYLGAGSMDTTTDWACESDQALAQYGSTVAHAGDLNGDGYDDVLVCAAGYDYFAGDEGRVFVYLGSPTGLPQCCAAFTYESPQPSQNANVYSVAAAGDVDGDGYGDLVLGMPGYDDAFVDDGKAVVFHGAGNWVCAPGQALSCNGEGINEDFLFTNPPVIGHAWNAGVTLASIGHNHGGGGPMSLKIRSTVLCGPSGGANTTAGGVLTEFLITGTQYATIAGFSNGVNGVFAPQLIPLDYSLVGLQWAAQATVNGGGIFDLSTAAFGQIGSY